MLYMINHGAVSYGANTILTNINFEINAGQKIAVVGRNGCGKTTLLKLIEGEVELEKRDSDEDIYIAKSGNPVIGYLKQIAFADETISMETEVRKVFEPYREKQRELEAQRQIMESDPSELNIRIYTQMQEQFTDMGGYYYEKEYETMLRKFGFTEADKKKPLREFSGGQQTKLGFIKMLLSKPDILLIVSHDRLFLDRIVDTVYEIEYGITHRYSGNYTSFVEQKKAAWDKQEKDYQAQQKEIARLMEIVEKFKNKPTKVAMTRSKLKQIEHMEKIAPPQRYDLKAFHANFQPEVETGMEVFTARNLQIGYDRVLSEVNLTLERGQKLGIVGGNGLGKSTFLKTMMGMIQPLGGEYQYGIRVQIGYFDQQMAHYTSDATVMDDYWAEYPNLTQTEVRNALGAFLFTGDDVFKQVSMLSGGERVRLALCKILKKKPNLLILDEPTNHMDIVGKEALEQMLKGYQGTLVFVSHDRYFVRQVADKILSFDGGVTTYYPFGYEQYEEATADKDDQVSFGKYAAVSPAAKLAIEQEKNKTAASASSKTLYANPGKERSRLSAKVKKAEAAVEACEEALSKLQDELNDPAIAASYSKLQEAQKKVDAKEEELNGLMEVWEQASAELDAFEESLAK